MKNTKLSSQLFIITIAAICMAGCAARDRATRRSPAERGAGNALPLKLSQIRAGQPAVGKDQIAYKVGRYDGVVWPDNIPPGPAGMLAAGRWYSIDQKMFEDAAAANGQTARAGSAYSTVVDRRDSAGGLAEPGVPFPDAPHAYSVTFEGEGPLKGKTVSPGYNEDGMKSVVRAPDNHYYLTDGHHATVMFSSIKRGGDRGRRNRDFTLFLALEHDYADLTDTNGNGSAMDEFWIVAANHNQVWLKILNTRDHRYEYLPGVTGSEKRYHVHSVDLEKFAGCLPATMRYRDFADDPYRGILYFCRGIGWDKPTEGKARDLAFLEFYWAEEIQEAIRAGESQLDLSKYELSDLGHYVSAVRAISEWMAGLPSTTEIGTSGYTAAEMGQLQLSKKKFSKALGELIDASEPKDGRPTKFLNPADSDEPDAASIGPLPKPGKWAYAWAARYGPSRILPDSRRPVGGPRISRRGEGRFSKGAPP